MKTKHEKIVEILKDQLLEKGNRFFKPLYNNAPTIKEIESIATAILEQLEPERQVYVECNTAAPDSIYIDANDNDGKWIGWIKKVPPPQQPSEGEISDIFLNNTVDYYGTAYMIFDGFKAAIKELNR